ncbi:MAG: single-stranded DNA-binding protein [Spirochaetales bacterium]|nr:single-stranded DNA-binding protein [Spirochaetales bacterium]
MSADINHVTIIGRLTRDAELKYLPSGYAVSKLSIAVNRRKRSGDTWVDEVSYFDIVLWGKSAEALDPYLKKGTRIAVDGELRQERWTQDNQNRSKIEIVASSIQLLGGSASNSAGSDAPRERRPENTNVNKNSSMSNSSFTPSSYDEMTDFDDDIPF